MPYILISRHQITAIHEQLESVTGQPFVFKVVQNDATTLLCAWQNDTHVDYLLHVMVQRNRLFRVAFAIQRYRDIETYYDRSLTLEETRSLFNNPRQCVRYMTGQEIGLSRFRTG